VPVIDLLTAIALVLALEGILYAAFPDAMRRALVTLLSMPQNQVRTIGLVTALIGVGLLWLLRG
jgi:hypothetical protein